MTTSIQYRAVTERRNLDNFGLAGAIHGAIDDSVLLWDLAAFVNNGAVRGVAPNGTWPAFALFIPPFPWVIENNLAANGTILKLRRRGVWIATFSANVLGPVAPAFGISLDAPAATLLSANPPLNTLPGIKQGLDVQSVDSLAPMPVTLSAVIEISDAMAGDPLRGLVRFHGTLSPPGGGDLPGSDLDPATARYTIAYTGDFMGS